MEDQLFFILSAPLSLVLAVTASPGDAQARGTGQVQLLERDIAIVHTGGLNEDDAAHNISSAEYARYEQMVSVNIQEKISSRDLLWSSSFIPAQ